MSLTGRQITAYDPTKIVQSDQQGVEVNFQTLNNLQYTDRGIIGTPGMSKINSTTALTSFPKIDNVFQFNKTQPDESHVMVQAFDSNEDNSTVFKNDTVIPNTGDFNSTAVHTDARSSGSITAFAQNGTRVTVTSAAHLRQNGEMVVISGTTSYNGIHVVESQTTNAFDIVATFVANDATGTWATRRQGRFSNAPITHMCYCNGQETMIWGGDQSKVAGFVLFDANAGTFIKDFSEQVKNTKTDAPNVATMTQDGAGTPTVSLHIGSVLPIESITFYIGTANGVAGTLSVDYWDGTAWQSVSSLVDGTASGGVPFAQTGTVTFSTTESVAKTDMQYGILGFWFRVQITNCANTATVSRVTLGVPFQPLQDLWDQVPKQFAKIHHLDSASNYNDISINLSQDSFFYDSTATAGDDSTYFDVGGISPDLIIGAFERIQGFQFKLIPGQKNAIASTTMTVSYWDGNAYQALTIQDGTNVGNISLAQSGTVSWNPNAEVVEFKQSIALSEALYYYKVSFDKTLTVSPVNLFFASYIPVQRLVQGYKFSINAKNRLFLFSDQTGDKNKMIVTATNTVNVFNGKDSGDPVFFGQDDVDIQSAVEIFARFTAILQSVIVVCQSNSTYVLFGDTPEDWSVLPISTTIGCSAPLTMKSSPIGFEFTPLQTKQVAIWLHSNGVYMFDVEHGLNIISNDISDLFDQRNSGAINLKHISRATSVWNLVNGEYFWHVFMPTGSSSVNDTEKAFDLKRRKWFTVKRTPLGDTNKNIQAATEIIASNGSNYTYGVEDNGYLQRMNNGTDYDGNNIEAEFRVGDIAFANGDTLIVSKVRHVQMPQVAKTTTTNNITVTHYADGQTSGNSFSLSPVKTGRRIAIPSMRQGIDLDPGVFHSLNAKLITNDETIPFEPLFLSTRVEAVREEKGEVS